MPTAPRPLCEQTYALRLLGPVGGKAHTLAGELEHVLSGDCVSFQSGAGLLAALLQLQAQRESVPVSAGHGPAVED